MPLKLTLYIDPHKRKEMFRPVIFNEKVCDGCNMCVEVCLLDIFERNPEKGKPPILKYPDECAYDGACWLCCPLRDEGAIKIVPPLPMKVSILRGTDKDLSFQSKKKEKM
jgi:NAD-dependent dihydropyrimidine dehydrogenase PreA subunit